MATWRRLHRLRIGKIQIHAPDLTAIYRSNDRILFPLMSCGEFPLFGNGFDNIYAVDSYRARNIRIERNRTITLPLDRFLNQRTLCLKGSWVCRRDIIQYVANIAGGVHSSDPRTEAHLLINEARHAFRITPDYDKRRFSIEIVLDVMLPTETPIVADRKAIDLALLQLISTAHYLTTSAHIHHLEEKVRLESL